MIKSAFATSLSVIICALIVSVVVDKELLSAQSSVTLPPHEAHPIHESSSMGRALQAYEVSNIAAMKVDGLRYERANNRFIAVVVPAYTKYILINRSSALNITSGYAVNKLPRQGTFSGFVVFPLPMDGGQDQTFEIRLNMKFDTTPYSGPWKWSELPKLTCEDLQLKCVPESKRRAVR